MVQKGDRIGMMKSGRGSIVFPKADVREVVINRDRSGRVTVVALGNW